MPMPPPLPAIQISKFLAAARHGLLESLQARLSSLPEDQRLAWGMATDLDEDTALIVAARHGQYHSLPALLPYSHAGAKNANQETALMLVAKAGHAPSVALLLDTADPTAYDANGETALTMALRGRHVECVRLLAPLSRLRPPPPERPPAGPLFTAVEVGDLACLDALLPHCDARIHDAHERTALMRVVDLSRPDLVRALLPLSDLEAIDDSGNTVLMRAANGASVSSHSIASSPSSNSSNSSNSSHSSHFPHSRPTAFGGTKLTAGIIAELATGTSAEHAPELTAELTSQPIAPWTPDLECFQLLLQAGANAHQPNANGKTVLDHVIGSHRQQQLFARLLLETVDYAPEILVQALFRTLNTGAHPATPLLIQAACKSLGGGDAGWRALGACVNTNLHSDDRLYGGTLLHHAVCSGEALPPALLATCDFLARTTHGDTPLLLAARRGDVSQLQRLLAVPAASASALAINAQGQTALMLAARARDAQALELLLPWSDPHAQDERGRTAIFYAAEASNAPGVALLRPVSPAGAQDHRGNTALMMTVQALRVRPSAARLMPKPIAPDVMARMLATQQLLLTDPTEHAFDAAGDSPLMAALRRVPTHSQALEMCDALAPHDPHLAADGYHSHALFLALQAYHEPLSLQLEHTAQRAGPGGQTALMLSIAQGLDTDVGVYSNFRRLLPLSDAQAVDAYGMSALMKVAATSGCEAGLALISRSDLGATDWDGDTALHFALRRQWDKGVDHLLRRMPLPLRPNHAGETALMLAAEANSAHFSRLLGLCDPLATNVQGQTALMRAAGAGHEPVVRQLLKCSDAFACDHQGRQAFDYALTVTDPAAQLLCIDALAPFAGLHQLQRAMALRADYVHRSGGSSGFMAQTQAAFERAKLAQTLQETRAGATSSPSSTATATTEPAQSTFSPAALPRRRPSSRL